MHTPALLAAACSLPLFAVSAAGANDRNLLANPSFERGIENWRFWEQFPGEPSGRVDTSAGKFGRASFRVENPGRGGANLFSDNVPCEPGKPYTISVYVRTKGIAKAGITAWAIAEDAEATIAYSIGSAVTLPPDEMPVFTRFRHMFITPPDCRYVRAHLTCTGGTVWWDAVQIERGAGRAAGTYEDADVLAERAKLAEGAPRNLLPNSSFETGATGWRLWQQVPGESTGEAEPAPGAVGARAYHVVNRGTKGSNFFNEGVRCEPGQTYTLSLYVKTRNSHGVKVAAWALDAGGKTISYGVDEPVPVPATTGKFVRITKAFRAPADAARLRAHLICNGGEVWWDAVQLEAGPNATEYVDGPTLSRHWTEAVDYANAVVREARARDLMQQVDRLATYRSKRPGDADAAREALSDVTTLMQVHDQLPDYVNTDYTATNTRLAAAEEALSAAFKQLTGRTPSHEPWRPKLNPHMSKQELYREFMIFPIMAYELLNGKTSWDVIEPFGWRAISWMHARGFERPDGGFDFTEMTRRVEKLREHGYHTVFELTPYAGGMISRLEKECGEDAYFHNADGEWSPRAHCHDVINIWHPRVRDGFIDYFRAMGKALRGVPHALAYELINEPSMQIARKREGGDQYDYDHLGFGGYSKPARAAWSKWLTAKYGTIDGLNTKWGAKYAAFADVPPPGDTKPPAPSDSRTRHPIAAIVDFHRFRAESYTRYYAGLLTALHEGDPVHAVMSEFCGLAPDRKEAGLDYLDMACNAEWDIFGTHDWPGHRPAVLSLYAASMNRYAKRPHWEDEFIWSQWERKGTPEPVMRAANERNLWRQIAYGKRGIILFNLSNEWAHTKPGNWNNSILNVEADYQIPRYSTGIFPVIERKVTAFKEAVLDTELTNQGLAILRPTTSSYAAAPDRLTRSDATAIAGRLLTRHWMPLFVPEECILDGREDLSKLRVVIAPYATHVAAGIEEKLLAWVRDGGVLICSGPLGLFDELGAPMGKLMRDVFGIDELKYDQGANAWRVAKRRERQTVREIAEYVFEAAHGHGRVWLSIAPLGRTKAYDAMREPLAEAFPVQPITCDVTQKLELILRNTGDDQHYLFATNLDPRSRLDTTVLLPGKCSEVVDLCIEGGSAVPVQRTPLSVRIPLHLAPGKGVVFKLGKLERPTTEEERRLRGQLAADRERLFEALLARAAKPASSPLASARQESGLHFARLAKAGGDMEAAKHFVECAGVVPEGRERAAVPRLAEGPALDGDLADWRGARWQHISSRRKVFGQTDGDADASARFALGRLDDTLYLAVEVRDDVVRNEQRTDTLWQEDCLEVFLDLMADGEATAGEYGLDDFQFFLAASGKQQVQTKQDGVACEFEVRKTKRGYRVEAAFDLRRMGLVPANGTLIGFDLAIDDTDGGPERESQLAWRGTARNFRDTRGFARTRIE